MDYRKVFVIKQERENRIQKICPNIPNSSGIYAFYRVDEAGIRRSYVGQALRLRERCASHLAEYDHIALSLKKHKFYSESNPTGWKLAYNNGDHWTRKDIRSRKELVKIIENSFQQWKISVMNLTAGNS